MSIVEQVQNVTNENKESPSITKYRNAIEMYQHLIDEGLATPRGNRLLSIEDRTLHSYDTCDDQIAKTACYC